VDCWDSRFIGAAPQVSSAVRLMPPPIHEIVIRRRLRSDGRADQQRLFFRGMLGGRAGIDRSPQIAEFPGSSATPRRPVRCHSTSAPTRSARYTIYGALAPREAKTHAFAGCAPLDDPADLRVYEGAPGRPRYGLALQPAPGNVLPRRERDSHTDRLAKVVPRCGRHLGVDRRIEKATGQIRELL
jgi:hypothetical protein